MPVAVLGRVGAGRKCSVENCGQRHCALGFCDLHYRRLKKGVDLNRPIVSRAKSPVVRLCSRVDCTRRSYAYDLCAAHYVWRLRRKLPFDRPPRHGPNVPGKPKGHVNHHGYRLVVNPMTKGVTGEHRLVLQAVIGRPLRRDESVHHRNGDRLDNRPENLELWSSSQPPGQRIADKLKWAEEIVSRYGQECGLGGGCE